MTGLEILEAAVLFAKAHPEVSCPGLEQNIYVVDKEVLIAVARVPGARKVYDDSYLNITVPLIGDHTLNYFTHRSAVCEVIETTKVRIAATEAYEYDKPTKWKCHPLLEPDGDKGDKDVKDGGEPW